MINEDFKKFTQIMIALSEEFNGKLSKGSIKIRFGLLKEYSIEDFSKGCTWIFKNRESSYPPVPTIKEIIDAIKKISGGVGVKIRAEIEADKVLKKLKEWGEDAQPLFYDEITKYLMTERWTFLKLNQIGIKDPGLVWFRKHFVEAYVELSEEQEIQESLPGVQSSNCLIPVNNLKKLLGKK